MNNDDFVAYVKKNWPGTYAVACHDLERMKNEGDEGRNDVEQPAHDMNVSPICLGAVFDDVRRNAAFLMELFGYHNNEDGERHADYKPFDCMMGITYALNALNNDLEALASLHSVDD